MRLDAHKGDSGWFVWDCRRMRKVERCVWVDDSAPAYGAWESDDEWRFAILSGGAYSPTQPSPPPTYCERIVIISTSRLVLIDPVGDEEKELIEVAISRPVPLDA